MNVQSKVVVDTIKLPPLSIATINIPIVGDSPLLIHRFSQKAQDMMLDKQMKRANPGKQERNPWSDFCESLYWMDGMPAKPTDEDVETARFGFPAIGFKSSAVTACTSLGKDITKLAARQAFHIDHELVQIHGIPKLRQDVVRIGMGTTDLRFRPEFMPWSAVLPVKYNTRAISAEQLINLFETAGFAVGIGEWRPQRDGQFGRFHVARSEVGS
jgi:hypothetical protein